MSEKNLWVIDADTDGYVCTRGTALGWSVRLDARTTTPAASAWGAASGGAVPRLWAYRNPAGTIVGHEHSAMQAKQAAARVARTGRTF